jgi:HAD superfamily hydrolase (TIGR01509 family)
VGAFTVHLPAGEFDGFIFDCDGTLIDSMPLHWHAWRAALEAQNAPFEFTIDMHHEFAGMSIPEIVRACNRRFACALDERAVECGREDYFFSHLDELIAVEPVVAFARGQWHKKPLAVASGSDRRIVERELDQLDLAELFPVIVTARDVSRSKPYPDIFLLAAKEMGINPERCLVFEDGKNGLAAAAAAGMQSVYVPTNEAEWLRPEL